MYILKELFQLMVDKNRQRDTDNKKTDRLAVRFRQDGIVNELGVDGPNAGENHVQKDYHFYHASKSGGGHTVFCREAIE